MKIFQMFFLSLATGVLLAACNPSPPPVVPPVVTEPTAFDLGITVTGAPNAPVKVLNAAGEIKFDDTVTGSKTLSALPKGKYTVTGGAVANFTAPAVQTADLSAGNGSVTLGYVAAAGQALDKIQGTLSDPQAPGNTLKVFFGNSVVASSKVGADGNVSLSLPAPPPASLTPFLPPAGSSCTYTGAPNAGKVFVTDNVRLTGSQGDAIGAVTEQPVGGSSTASVLHAYADIAQNNQGTIACFGSPPVKVDVRLLPGWNVLIIDKDAGGTITVVTAPPEARVQLKLDKFPANVSIVLDAPSLTLKAGESVTVNATIFQRGGLSGKIDLSTDVPGVTVDPASVTLPVLATQSVGGQSLLDSLVFTSYGLSPLNVGAQRLNTVLTFKASADAKGFTGTMNLIASQGGKQIGQTGVSLNLVAPSVTATIQYAQNITVQRGQSVPVTVQTLGRNFYKGDAKLTLEGLPDGVTATTGLVSFSGVDVLEPQNVQLQLTASSLAKAGTTQGQLVVTANGTVTRSDIGIYVPTPVVVTSFPSYSGYGPLNVFQGESAVLAVNLKSEYGFSGSTVIMLTGLPVGVTAAPITINLPQNGEVNANFNLTVSSSASFAPSSVSIQGDNLDPNSAASLSVQVNAGRFQLSDSFAFMTTSSAGVWTLSEDRSLNGSSGRVLSRYQGGGRVFSKTVATPTWVTQLASTPEGNAVIVTPYSIIQVSETGIVTSTDIINGPAGTKGIVDHQHRLWAVSTNPLSGGSQIVTFDLNTGIRVPVADFSNYSVNLYTDSAVKAVYVTGLVSGGTVTKIDSTTLQREDISIPGVSSIQALAISSGGDLWGSMFMGGIFKLNADKTANIYSNLGGGSTLDFDLSSQGILWASDSFGAVNGVAKIDITSLSRTYIPIGSTVRGVALNASGGLWVGTALNSNSYLSQLK